MNDIDIKQNNLKNMTKESPKLEKLGDDTEIYGPFDNIEDLIKALNS